jgi:iron complex outermembrane recepter protein
VFKNNGSDLRLQARHAKLGALDGVVGVQLDESQFSADGAEAFAPYSSTRQSALFAHEELSTSWGKLSFGARVESVNVESQGNPQLARFTPASRSFNPTSYAPTANAHPKTTSCLPMARTSRLTRMKWVTPTSAKSSPPTSTLA